MGRSLLPLGAAMLTGIALSPRLAISQSSSPAVAALPEVKVVGSGAQDDYKPDLSTIGGGAPMAIRDIPQTVTIVNNALMQAQGATSLADALRNVPGITIGAAEGGSIGNNFNLRGFSARTDVYLDGMRDRGQYYRDVFSLDAVEVLQGPSSMLFGRGSTGGVINQASKLPILVPFGTATLTVGTQPSVRATVDLNQPLDDNSAFRVAAMAQDVHSTRDVMKNEDYGLAPSIRLGIGQQTEVTLNALLMHNHDMPDYGLPPVNGAPADVNRRNFYGATDDRTIQDVVNLNATISHVFNAKVKLRNQTQYSRYTIDARESGPNNVGTLDNGVYAAFPAANLSNTTPLPLDVLYVGLGSHDRNINDWSLSNQTDLISEFATSPIRHVLITGLELGQDSNNTQNYTRNIPGDPNNYLRAVSLLNPAYEPADGIPEVTGNLVQSSASDVAPYLNDTMSFADAWKVVAGLRYDRYNARLTNSINPPSSASQTIGYTSVRTGVIYQPTAAQSYYFSYGTSFNPSLETLTLVNGQQSLDPETSRQYELGAKWDLLGDQLSLTAAVFDIEKDRVRSQISAGVYELTGDIRVKGFQASVAGRITPAWQVFGGYTYLDAEIVKASVLDATQGKVPANTPTNSASLWTAYNFIHDWQAGIGVAYMSDRYASNNNAVKAPDYFRWDAMLAWQQRAYTVQLNAFNLTNRRNYDALIPSDRGRSVPGTNLQALLSVIYESPMMLLQVPNVLSAAQIRDVRARLDATGAPWVDGRATAGHQGAQVKRNQQIAEDTAVARKLGALVLGVLERHPLFLSAALPVRIYPPMFNRYARAETFGSHVDGAVRLLPGTGAQIRTDIAATLFLSAPEDYDGGDLVVNETYGPHCVKLPAGDMVLYPATSVHQVTPVTRGARIASVLWVQSLVRDDAQRALLFDLDMAIVKLTQDAPGHASLVALTGTYHNLLRMWASP